MPGCDHGAVDRLQADASAAVLVGDLDDRCERGEGDALQERQTHADLPESDRLEQRRDAAREEVCGDEHRQRFVVEVDRAGDQQRHQDRARVERDDVLGTERDHLADRGNLVDGVDALVPRGGCRDGFGRHWSPTVIATGGIMDPRTRPRQTADRILRQG